MLLWWWRWFDYYYLLNILKPPPKSIFSFWITQQNTCYLCFLFSFINFYAFFQYPISILPSDIAHVSTKEGYQTFRGGFKPIIKRCRYNKLLNLYRKWLVYHLLPKLPCDWSTSSRSPTSSKPHLPPPQQNPNQLGCHSPVTISKVNRTHFMLMPESCSEDEDVMEISRHKAGIELITCVGI